MTKDENKTLDSAELRRRAEERVREIRAKKGLLSPSGDPKRLIHELAVHEIELELVNEELRRANEEIEAGLAKYTDLYDFAPVGYLTLDREGTIRSANLTAVTLFGVDRARLMNQAFHRYVSVGDRPAFHAFLKDVFEGRDKPAWEAALFKEGDRTFFARCEASVSGSGQECRMVVADITERKRLEDQVRQKHKMEAVGKLAGGLAHDFNNILTAILGYCDLGLRQLAEKDPQRHILEEIRKASERCATLTNQLLAFSRKQVLIPKVVKLNDIVRGIENMLRRLIREDIVLSTRLEEDLGNVRADSVQFEQILLNLVVNSRDAMPQGGNLLIETANITIGETHELGRFEIAPGAYVMLAVTDTGCGMEENIQSHIFEPFFTTKEGGTGLGLSTVYGIVKQSGGYIVFESKPGIGTTFRIFLKRIEEAIGKEAIPIAISEGEHAGHETVLLAEDEIIVRDITRQFLELNDYMVLEARDGEEALRICKEFKGKIHLLLTDVVMPGMGGAILAREVMLLRPETKVLYMSGYTRDAILDHGDLKPGIEFIQKPFRIDFLASKIRQILDAESTGH